MHTTTENETTTVFEQDQQLHRPIEVTGIQESQRLNLRKPQPQTQS